MNRYQSIRPLFNLFLSTIVLLSLLVSISAEAATEFQLIKSIGKLEGTPYAKLIRDSAGNLYGTTPSGGNNGYGTIFKLDSSGNFSVLHHFNYSDGSYPFGELIQASDGSLYGGTNSGGGYDQGTLFKIDLTGNFTVLHEFTGNLIEGTVDGAYPVGSLIQSSEGNFYGVTASTALRVAASWMTV